MKAAKNSLGMVKYLCSRGADVNVKSFFDSTPLIAAAEAGKLDIVEYLIEKGADINFTSCYGRNAISSAYNKKFDDIFEFLVSKGARIETIRSTGGNMCILNILARRGDIDTLDSYVKRGADINYQDKRGYTPLHYAAEARNIETIKYLLKHGANFSIKNNHGETASELIIKWNDRHLLDDYLRKPASRWHVKRKKTEHTMHNIENMNANDSVLL